MRYKSYSTCDSQGHSQIKEIYETSFPKSEKFPFWVLKQCAKENNVRLDAIIDHNTDKIIGMNFLIFYDETELFNSRQRTVPCPVVAVWMFTATWWKPVSSKVCWKHRK